MTFRFANVSGRAALVGRDPDGLDLWYDLERISGGSFGSDVMGAISRSDELHELADGLGDQPAGGTFADALTAGEVGPPVPRPAKCFGIGLNYRSHAAESGLEVPERPLVFTKFPSCLVGPRANIELRSETADWEVELVIVIGRGGRDIPTSQAWDHVLGLTGGQDISDRALQFASTPPQFDLGKSRDTYGPTGPLLVSTDSFDDPDDIGITCEINGERHQHDRTSNLIFDVPALIAYLSEILLLQTGDLIFTGTPDGVGAGKGRYLRPGDEIVSTIEGVGTLVNRCTSGVR